MVSSSAPPQTPQLRNDLQIQRYDLFQDFKYVCGKQVDWNAYAHANFYSIVKKYLEDMSCMSLANLAEMNYSPLFVNEFYFGILVHVDKYENSIRFKEDVLYTLFDGKEYVLSEANLRKPLRCEHYAGPHETHDHYPADNVWETVKIGSHQKDSILSQVLTS